MIPMLFFMYQFYFPTRKVSTVLRNVHCLYIFFFFLAHCQKTTGGTVHKSCVSPSEKTYYCLK